jgi:hypothetical protein
MTSTEQTETTDEFTERTLWRDALDALLALVGRGQDVDPVELSETRARAEAEEQVETGRRARAERKRIEREQSEAAKRADALAEGIDPNPRAGSDERIAAAYEQYLAAVEAEVEAMKAHSERVYELARAAEQAGTPLVESMNARSAEGDHIVPTPSYPKRRTVTWRGTRYVQHTVTTDRLPHVTDKSERRRRIEQMRGTVY